MSGKQKTKYYRTVVTVEVLSKGGVPDFDSLADLSYLITDGECSGSWKQESQQVPKKRMMELLEAQGSDPSFLVEQGD